MSDDMPATTLPRPGLLGRALRLMLGTMVLWMLVTSVTSARGFWDGIGPDPGLLPLVAVLVLLSGWVLNELLGTTWGLRPTIGLLVGAGVMAAVGAWQGDAWGPLLGIYLWAWAVLFSVFLAPAFLLAAALGTPGCEMRSYAHLWARMHGGDPAMVTCPGWIDRFDSVRLFGRW